MTDIAIMGAAGRMGRMLIGSVLAHNDCRLVGAFVRPQSEFLGVDAGELIGQKPAKLFLSALSVENGTPEVLIDFSLPEAFEQVLEFCLTNKVALVVGTTGLSENQENKLKQASQHIAIVYAGNYSWGVNLSLNLLATTTKVFPDADVEIIEKHHKHKKDAPSGTALMMAKVVANARHQSLNEVLVNGRVGDSKRTQGEIGMHAIRGGEIIGEHTVQFIMGGEIIEITHKAQNRTVFADGAVQAGLWLKNKPAGLYDMMAVLGLN